MSVRIFNFFFSQYFCLPVCFGLGLSLCRLVSVSPVLSVIFLCVESFFFYLVSPSLSVSAQSVFLWPRVLFLFSGWLHHFPSVSPSTSLHLFDSLSIYSPLHLCICVLVDIFAAVSVSFRLISPSKHLFLNDSVSVFSPCVCVSGHLCVGLSEWIYLFSCRSVPLLPLPRCRCKCISWNRWFCHPDEKLVMVLCWCMACWASMRTAGCVGLSRNNVIYLWASWYC